MKKPFTIKSIFSLFLVLPLSGLFLTACQTIRTQENPSSRTGTVIFEDSFTGDWSENWFLEGDKAILETSEDGLHFIASTIPGIWQTRSESPEMRELFDSLHAVIWTRQEFEGEIAVSFEMTRTSEGFTFLLYMLAQGVGWGPYEEDIADWQELREIPRMSLYFHNMNLTGVTFRNQLRLRRYPWMDEAGVDFTDNLIGEMIDYDQIPVGNTYKVDVELRTATMRFRIEEVGNPSNIVDKTFDRISDLDPRRPAPSTRGRIGLRHMTGTSVQYRNFQVRQL
jgi:hypothetical protein